MNETELYSYFMGNMDLEGLDVTTQNLLDMDFTSLVEELLANGMDAISFQTIGKIFLEVLWSQLLAVRPLFIELFAIAMLFCVVSRFFVSEKRYVTQISFLAIYATMLAMLLRSFLLVKEIVEMGCNQVFEFLSVLIPAYTAALTFSAHPVSAGSFYELAFGMIYVLEWGIGKLLLPAVELYVGLILVNCLFEESMFEKASDFLGSCIGGVLKIAVGGVLSLGTVQNLISPAKDQLTGSTLAKALEAMPAVGNGAEVAKEVLLGCGVLVKNCVGIAGIFVLIGIALIPLLKIVAFYLLYQILLIGLEPLADVKLLACVEGTKKGCLFYLKVMGCVLLLFLIALAMSTMSTH